MGAAAGALARLAQQIKRLLQVEAELAKAKKKDRKLERDAEKQRKLEAAMAKERAARVSAPTLRLAFDAAQAAAESDESERVKSKQKHFEDSGHTFIVNVSQPMQPHFQLLSRQRRCVRRAARRQAR